MQCGYIHSTHPCHPNASVICRLHGRTHNLNHPCTHPLALIHAIWMLQLYVHYLHITLIHFRVRPLTRPPHPQAYLKKKDVEAQLGFTESIRLAPEGSTVLPLAYGNRSAVLYQLKKYKVSWCHNPEHTLYSDLPGPFRPARITRGALRCNPWGLDGSFMVQKVAITSPRAVF